jgi:hypothetical protein
VFSAKADLPYGVPQGSVLGPVLFVLYATPVSAIISRHALKHESFADDTQAHLSVAVGECDELVPRVRGCVLDLKDWMTDNKLKLNDEKTELMLVCPRKFQNNPSVPTSMQIGNNEISFSSSVRSLGVMIDSTLSFEQHISGICKVAYLEMRRISSIRHYLSAAATKTLICAFVLSRLDYCNSLLAGIQQYQLDRLQKVQNNAARLISQTRRNEHVSPLLHSLHWLKITERINYKLASLTFTAVRDSLPQYLADSLHIYSPARTLRSSSDSRMLTTVPYKKKTFGYRSFSCQAPSIWNPLPMSLRHSTNAATFKRNLKTYLFK